MRDSSPLKDKKYFCCWMLQAETVGTALLKCHDVGTLRLLPLFGPSGLCARTSLSLGSSLSLSGWCTFTCLVGIISKSTPRYELLYVDQNNIWSSYILRKVRSRNVYTFEDYQVLGIYAPYPDRMDRHSLANREPSHAGSFHSSF